MAEERLVGGQSGDDTNAKVFLELLKEDEGEHCVGNQADSCRNKSLVKCQWTQFGRFS